MLENDPDDRIGLDKRFSSSAESVKSSGFQRKAKRSFADFLVADELVENKRLKAEAHHDRTVRSENTANTAGIISHEKGEITTEDVHSGDTAEQPIISHENIDRSSENNAALFSTKDTEHNLSFEVEILQTGGSLMITLLANSTVSQVKEAIFSASGIDPAVQSLIVYPKTLLFDSNPIRDYLLEDGQKIWLVIGQSDESHCNLIEDSFHSANTVHFPNVIHSTNVVQSPNAIQSINVIQSTSTIHSPTVIQSSTALIPHQFSLIEALMNQSVLDSLCFQLSQHQVIENNCCCCGKRIKLNLFSCKYCKNDFCLSHRHPEVHQCNGRGWNEHH